MSIRLNLLLGVAIAQALVIGTITYAGLRWFENTLETQLLLRAETVVKSLASASQGAVLDDDAPSLEDLVRNALSDPAVVAARLSSPSGVTLAKSASQDFAMPRAENLAENSLLGSGPLDVSADVFSNGDMIGRANVTVTPQVYAAELGEVRRIGTILAAVEIALVSALLLAFHSSLRRRLKRLHDASRKIALEGPGHRVPVTGEDEVAKAIRGFNAMSTRLAESYAEQDHALREARALSHGLEASDAQKTALVEAALDAIITIDLQGNVLEYNTSAERLFKFTREEVLGKPLEELIIPARLRRAHTAGMAKFRDEGVGPVLGQRLELPAVQKDGNEILVEISITHAEAGRSRYFTAFMRDISERKRNEQELRLAAQAFDAGEAICVTDAAGDILRVNNAFTEITGIEPEEVVGANFVSFRDCAHSEPYERLWAELRAAGHWEGEIESTDSEGHHHWEWLRLSAVRGTDDAVTHYVAHFTDVTERKSSEAELRDSRIRAESASLAKSRFLATMSHEIRTPLNAIINMNDLLLDTALDDRQRTYAVTAAEAGRGLLSIVNSVLDFSRIEAGQIDTTPTLFDPEEVVEAVAGLLSPRAIAKNIELTVFVAADVPEQIETDAGLLRQILLNLVGNAIKFTSDGGVAIRLVRCQGEAGSWIRFDVVDTGIGISEEQQRCLFEEFVQADSSHRRRYGGTGLGLAISKELARVLRGKIDMQSTANEGSRFSLLIPLDSRNMANARRQGTTSRLQHLDFQVYGTKPQVKRETLDQLQALGLRATVADPDEQVRQAFLNTDCVGVVKIGNHPDGNRGNSPMLRLLRRGLGHQPADDGSESETLDVPFTSRKLVESLTALAFGRPEEQTSEVQTEPDSSSRRTPQEGRILLVEDSAANQMVVEALLDHLGYTVDVANNGLEAVVSVQTNHYDLILMDLAMPEMDGFEATQVIRGMDSPSAETPIVALTADAFTADHQRCLDAGMNGYMSKPVDRAQLLATVEHWLESKNPNEDKTGITSDVSPEALLDETALQSLREDLSDELLPRMLSAFILEVSRRVPQIQRALAATNTIAAGQEAHALKGAAATFGARRLQVLAQRLEQAATDGDIPRLIELDGDLAPLAALTTAEFKNRFGLETDD